MELSRLEYAAAPLIKLYNQFVRLFFPSYKRDASAKLMADPIVAIPTAAMGIVSKHTQKEHPGITFTKELVDGSLPYQEAVEKQWVMNAIDIVKYPTSTALLIMFMNETIDEEEVRHHLDKFISYDETWASGVLTSVPKLAKENDPTFAHFAGLLCCAVEDYRIEGKLDRDIFRLDCTVEA